MDFSEAWILADKASKNSIAKAALRDWEGAERDAVAALALLYDYKLAVAAEKDRAPVA